MNTLARVVGAVALGAVVLGAAAAAGQPAGPPGRGADAGPVVRIIASDALDTIAQAAALEALLEEAKGAKAGLVVLELSGDGARLDVVNRMAGALRRAEVALAGYLTGGENDRVGAGQLALGLMTARMVAHPRVMVTGAARGASDELSPDDTAWAAVAAELRGRLEWGLGAREHGPDLAIALTGTCDGLRLVREGGRATLRVLPEGGANAEPVVRAGRDGCEFMLTRAALSEVGLVAAEAPAWREAARRLDVGGRMVLERRLPPGARAARGEALGHLARADEALARAQGALSLADPSTHSVAAKKYHEAGREARESLAHAERALDEFDALVERVPEVLRTAREDGDRRVRASQYESGWRKAARDARARAKTLRAKAADYLRQ
ncbi:MAG: hypothetical protein SFY69_05490 [Planctomycetota bacterium]|nr:hypothetical protein [Planctomycetota bacterium]